MTSALVVAPPCAVAAPPSLVTVQLDPNPFRPSLRRTLRVPHGSTVADLVAEVLELERGPLARRFHRGWQVRINGLSLAEHLHDRIVPPPGATVQVRLVPSGILATIIFAITAISEFIGGLAFAATVGALGFTGASIVAAVVATGAFIAIAGGLGYGLYAAYRSLTSAQTPGRLGSLAGAGGGAASSSSGSRSRSDSPTISGQGNTLAPFAPIWRLYGRHRIRPVIVGKPYTEIHGGAVYLRMLLCAGYGPLAISEERLGTTVILEGVGGKHRGKYNFRGFEVEVCEGWAGEPPPELYPGSAVQETYQIRLHSNGGGSTGSDGKTRTTSLETTEVGLELVFPGGFVAYNDQYEEEDRTMRFRVRYRESTGPGPWILPESDAATEVFKVTGKRAGSHGGPFVKITGDGIFEAYTTVKQRVYVGVRFFPGRAASRVKPGQYDVEVVVTNDVTAGGQVAAEVYWQSMRSMTANAAVNLDGLCLIAIRAKASNQLSGAIENFNCIAESYLRTWDPGTGWSGPVNPAPPAPGATHSEGWYIDRTVAGATVNVSRNPAWAYLDILTGRAQRAQDRLRDAHLDLGRIAEWAEVTSERGLTLDANIDYGGTTYQALADVAATGLGSPHMRDGKVSVVWERDTRNEYPVALITPRNILSKTFRGSKSFERVPHAFRVRFIDASQDYEFGEVVVYRDGYDASNASDYAELELWGVTSADLAWKYGRRRLAEILLRPEFYVVEQDIESLVLERGDLASLAHDVPLLGLSYGMVTEHTASGVTLDEEVTFEPGKSYGVMLRNAAEPFVILTLQVANPATVSLVKSKSLVYEQALGVDSIVSGALASFGERSIETRRVIVKEIEPLDGLDARITLVDEAVGIWDAMYGPIPDYDPGISFPVDSAPRPPVFVSIVSGDGVLVVELAPGQGGAIPPRYFEVWYRRTDPDEDDEGDWTRLQLIDVDGVETATIGPVFDGSYDIQARAIGGLLGRASSWARVDGVLYAEDATRYKASGLALKNSVGGDTFRGREPEIVWRLNDSTVPDDLSESGGELGVGILDYVVRVMDPATRAVIREDYVWDRRYVYGVAQQTADGWTGRRFWVGVAVRQVDNRIGEFRWLEVQNLAPRISSIVVTGGVGIVTASGIASPDLDRIGTKAWAATHGAYPDPADMPLDDSTLLYNTSSLTGFSTALAAGSYWIYVAQYDEWGVFELQPVGPFDVTVT
jgi:hypothetical protein